MFFFYNFNIYFGNPLVNSKSLQITKAISTLQGWLKWTIAKCISKHVTRHKTVTIYVHVETNQLKNASTQKLKTKSIVQNVANSWADCYQQRLVAVSERYCQNAWFPANSSQSLWLVYLQNVHLIVCGFHNNRKFYVSFMRAHHNSSTCKSNFICVPVVVFCGCLAWGEKKKCSTAVLSLSVEYKMNTR